MASMLLKLPIQTLKTQNPSLPFHSSKTHFPSLQPHQHHDPFSLFPQKPLKKSQTLSLSSKHSSTSTTTNPPTSKEEAILQAKTCLSLCLSKPLNNPRLAGKLKKLKQPKFRVEVPIIDESPNSLAQLSLQLFSDLPIIKRKSPSLSASGPVKILILWPNPTLSELAHSIFESWAESKSSSISVQNSDLPSSVSSSGPLISSADVIVFFGPETSQIEEMKRVCFQSGFYPKPVVVLNPKWGYEEEIGFGELGGFVGSFEVVYAFMGLEVRGILSKKRGVLFKGVSGSGGSEGWMVFMEEEEGDLKVISKFKKRPTVGEVENVLYNVMAINSPVTKSIKFIRDLVSNVTGKKER